VVQKPLKIHGCKNLILDDLIIEMKNNKEYEFVNL
jgi:hypothetical protein